MRERLTFLEAAERRGGLPAAVRVLIALDVIEATAALEPSRASGQQPRVALADVTLDQNGCASVPRAGSAVELTTLVWEVMGQRQCEGDVTPWTDPADDLPSEVLDIFASLSLRPATTLAEVVRRFAPAAPFAAAHSEVVDAIGPAPPANRTPVVPRDQSMPTIPAPAITAKALAGMSADVSALKRPAEKKAAPVPPSRANASRSAEQPSRRVMSDPRAQPPRRAQRPFAAIGAVKKKVPEAARVAISVVPADAQRSIEPVAVAPSNGPSNVPPSAPPNEIPASPLPFEGGQASVEEASPTSIADPLADASLSASLAEVELPIAAPRARRLWPLVTGGAVVIAAAVAFIVASSQATSEGPKVQNGQPRGLPLGERAAPTASADVTLLRASAEPAPEQSASTPPATASALATLVTQHAPPPALVGNLSGRTPPVPASVGASSSVPVSSSGVAPSAPAKTADTATASDPPATNATPAPASPPTSDAKAPPPAATTGAQAL